MTAIHPEREPDPNVKTPLPDEDDRNRYDEDAAPMGDEDDDDSIIPGPPLTNPD